jgi:hypothetical protein
MPKANPTQNPIPTVSSEHFLDGSVIINPKRDWKILVILFMCMLVGAFAFNAFIYTQITNGDMYVSVSKDELTLEMLKTKQLQSIIDDFKLRQTTVANMKIQPAIDPSL